MKHGPFLSAPLCATTFLLPIRIEKQTIYKGGNESFIVTHNPHTINNLL